MIPQLLFTITNCHILNLVKKSSLKQPCTKVVNSQIFENGTTNFKFQLPEPWNGDLLTSPILVVSSNPAHSIEELYPDESWPEGIIADFFINRFADRGHSKSWVFKNKILNKDGTRGKSVRYWSSIKKRIEELTGKTVIPGKDYCITELVQCKSNKEKGVKEALPSCSDLFFTEKIKLSNACIIVVIGSIARDYFNPNGGKINSFEGKKMIYLPHPNAFEPKKVTDHYDNNEILEFRELINKCICEKKEFTISNVSLPSENEVEEFIRLNTAPLKM